MRIVHRLPSTFSIGPGSDLVRQSRLTRGAKYRKNTPAVREVDLFNQWEIPLAAYKGIASGSQFTPMIDPRRRPSYEGSPLNHPRLESIPPPPEVSSVSSESTLNRTLVVKGLTESNLSTLLYRIHEGPLEYARLDREEVAPWTHSLTLSFLSSTAAHRFVHTHLSAPARLYEFTRAPDPSWEWHFPVVPLPQSVTDALEAHSARRAVSIAWFDAADKIAAGALGRFGTLEELWKFGPGRFIAHFCAIADAIRAHTELRANPKLRVSFFPDWCEMDEQGRSILSRHGRAGTRLDKWIVEARTGRASTRVVGANDTARDSKRVVTTPKASGTTPTASAPKRTAKVSSSGTKDAAKHTLEKSAFGFSADLSPVVLPDIRIFYLGQVMGSVTGRPPQDLPWTKPTELTGTQARAQTLLSLLLDVPVGGTRRGPSAHRGQFAKTMRRGKFALLGIEEEPAAAPTKAAVSSVKAAPSVPDPVARPVPNSFATAMTRKQGSLTRGRETGASASTQATDEATSKIRETEIEKKVKVTAEANQTVVAAKAAKNNRALRRRVSAISKVARAPASKPVNPPVQERFSTRKRERSSLRFPGPWQKWLLGEVAKSLTGSDMRRKDLLKGLQARVKHAKKRIMHSRTPHPSLKFHSRKWVLAEAVMGLTASRKLDRDFMQGLQAEVEDTTKKVMDPRSAANVREQNSGAHRMIRTIIKSQGLPHAPTDASSPHSTRGKATPVPVPDSAPTKGAPATVRRAERRKRAKAKTAKAITGEDASSTVVPATDRRKANEPKKESKTAKARAGDDTSGNGSVKADTAAIKTTADEGPTSTRDVTMRSATLRQSKTETASRKEQRSDRTRNRVDAASAKWRDIANIPLDTQSLTRKTDPSAAKRLDDILGLKYDG
ncbi:hypothetical protein K438DRAFT_1859466 [Mycena galopus ATCC 62051]|nr:hypothetical protein K438DRAFT_1859466 [Mycena galopus ATCC 62051]